MAFYIFTESQVVTPQSMGIRKGQCATVLCVGSGGGGMDGETKNSTYPGGAGGASGCGGKQSGFLYSGGGCGGGGGAGYGGGGGGGGGGGLRGTSGTVGCKGGNGGGAGEIKIKSVAITQDSIPITVGAPVAAGMNGQATSFGSLLSAPGGSFGQGGAGGAATTSSYSGTANIGGGGGGGGDGGFHLGKFLDLLDGGAGEKGGFVTGASNLPLFAGGNGGGITRDNSTEDAGFGGSANGTSAGGNGRCYTGMAGSGICLVWF